jgi:hypothetical protein
MSQIWNKTTAAGLGAVLTLTGNAGGPVGPSGLGNINVIGGADINITGNPGTNTLTVDFTGLSAIAWQVDPGAGPTALVDGIGHFANNAGTISYTLPALAQVGTVFAVAAMNNNTSWIINQGAGQSIIFGNLITTVGVGGSIASSSVGDVIVFVCNVVNTGFFAIQSIGNLTVV